MAESWSDPESTQKLAAALATYDWTSAREISERLIARARRERRPVAEEAALAVLGSLRKKRRFDLLSEVAEAFVLSGQSSPAVRQHYAQSLIDRGLLLAAEPILEALAGAGGDTSQSADAHGSLGRLFKQRYVDMGGRANPFADVYFNRALDEYLRVYRLDRRNTWHGINAVALIRRGEADGIDIPAEADADGLAREILASIDSEEGAEPSAFALATRVEALIALGEFQKAEQAALAFSGHPDTSAFEVGSALRQLEEVWRLTDSKAPGTTILPILRAAKVRCVSGSLQTAPADVDGEIKKVRTARSELEKVFGNDSTVTLQWYEQGLLRTKSVARIEKLNGKGHGTGWLVNAADFFPGRTGVLLLTNAHVVNPDGSGGALTPKQAKANFQGLRQVFSFEDAVVWSSPPDKLDATFLEFKQGGPVPEARPMPLSEEELRPAVPRPRIYIIGHPAGRDIELSLHDNELIASNHRLLHYRTPTEGGSSGSPVFEETGWAVVALHHAGGTYQGLDGQTPPPYEANEGIPILAIQEATRQVQQPQP